MTIDTHQHFWKYTPDEYAWIGEDSGVIRRDFLPADLLPQTRAAGVDAVISVQARQTLEETHWLLKLAGENKFIRGVVGWVSLTSEHVERDLQSVAADPVLRGVRYVLQGETDDQYMLRDDFNRGVATLKKLDLCYDILILERQLPFTIRFVDKHPDQVFILDHLAKPKIKAAELEPWATNLRELARRPNVYCKISGMVTEADWQAWTPQTLQPYFEVALEAFGPSRLMAGSDWPVCLLGCGYPRWWEILKKWADPLSPAERDLFLGGVAQAAYNLK